MPPRLEPEQNRALKGNGWNLFRSSTRDHLVPLVAIGRQTIGLRIREALPVAGVLVGADVALSAEERAARSSRTEASLSRAREDLGRGAVESVERSIAMTFAPEKQFAPVSVFDEETSLIGFAPADGYIDEVEFILRATGGVLTGFAIRTESGESAFRGFVQGNVSIGDLLPDFLPLGATQTYQRVANLRVPVLTGERVFIVVKMNALVAVNSLLLTGSVTVKIPVTVPRLDLSVGLNAGAVSSQVSTAATRQSLVLSQALAIEQERTRRSRVEFEAKVKIAEAAAEARRPASVPMSNPFQQLLLQESTARMLQQREPPPPPPPRVLPPPPTPAEGAGKTFVPAWLPSVGAIGYLIPTPSRTERVTVFDNRYTIWSVTGAKVKEGLVEMIRSEAGIPPEARISRELSG